ncbi:MAG: PLP-dependent aminotransferase family protein [Gammaproteobacteria bacterium]|nr:PLP-dependent aminotransferase family protein [Gammaproteobacteria bacterium]
MTGNLYERVAQRIAEQVNKGIYRPGQRVPSVRQLSDQLKVSVATVIEAYRRLEDEGVLEARPQSGYYVRQQRWQPPAEPEVSRPEGSPTTVSVTELAMKVLKNTRSADIVQFGVASPQAGFLPTRKLNRITTAILRDDQGVAHRYDFPPGLPALRQQIARRMVETGCEISPDEIVITSGCQEALNLCLRAVARPGDVIAVESPTYYGALQLIETLGMKVLEIPTHPRDGISVEALELALDRYSVRACVVGPSFSNPLGACMSDDSKRRLVRLLAEHGIPLIEDDIYADLAFNAPRPKAAKAFDRKGLVFYCSSFSKTISPGLRVGWTVPGRFQEQIEHLKYVNTQATATLSEMAIAEFLEHGGYERHLRNVRPIYAQNAERMVQAIARYFPEGTRVAQPSGGIVLWLELPAKVNGLELYKRALDRGISVAPGALFSAKQKYKNFIRLTFALSWNDRVEQGLFALGHLAKEMA